MIKKITLLSVLVLLTACSGSDSINGGDELSPEQGSANSELEPVVEPYTELAISGGQQASNSPATPTSEIVVTQQFEFRSAGTFAFSLDLEQVRGTESYVAVCPEFETLADGYSVDYDKCLLKTKIVDGLYQDELLLPNQYDSLIAVVWPTIPGVQPIYVELQP